MSENLKVEKITGRPLELRKNLTNQQSSNYKMYDKQKLNDEINFLQVLKQQLKNDAEKKSKRNRGK